MGGGGGKMKAELSCALPLLGHLVASPSRVSLGLAFGGQEGTHISMSWGTSSVSDRTCPGWTISLFMVVKSGMAATEPSRAPGLYLPKDGTSDHHALGWTHYFPLTKSKTEELYVPLPVRGGERPGCTVTQTN